MKKVLDKMALAVDLAAEPVPGQPLIEIFGQNRVIVENHKGVICYEHEEIRVRVCFGQIQITGKDLQLMKMCKPQLVICGKIDSVQLLCGGVGR